MSGGWDETSFNDDYEEINLPDTDEHLMRRDIGVCFNLVAFLKNHMNVLRMTENEVQTVSDVLRMTNTRDLNYLQDITYLVSLTFLKKTQKNKLWKLVVEVQADVRYSLDSEALDSEGAVEERAASEEKVAGLNPYGPTTLSVKLAALQTLVSTSSP